MSKKFSPIQFQNGTLTLIDQRKLPLEEIFIDYTDLEGGFSGIQDMVVRGAPCIGFTAIYTMALWINNHKDFSLEDIKKAGNKLKEARPTAVNLNFEIDRVIDLVKKCKDEGSDPYDAVVQFGDLQISESEVKNRSMAVHAENDLDKILGKDKYRILTHCNTGFLACGSIGTALGVVQNLGEKDKVERVWVDETRPYLQGARLTAYELVKLGIEHRVVVEGAASYLMKNKLVDAIFTGADRIVANGDTANKVGTSNLAILAKHYGIPFYIVAPSSSFDLSIDSGAGIDIELRPEEEILCYKDYRIAPNESRAFNPSFDITDGELITGIISENGIANGDYKKTLQGIVKL
jgi:methylthioribose-1-phosphate isomerase